MRLKRLYLNYLDYGDDMGRYKGTATFEGKCGTVELNLSPDHADKILAILANGLVDSARDVACNLAAECITAKAPDALKIA